MEPHVPALWWVVINSKLEPVLGDDMYVGDPSQACKHMPCLRRGGRDACLGLLGSPHCPPPAQEEKTVGRPVRSCFFLTLHQPWKAALMVQTLRPFLRGSV